MARKTHKPTRDELVAKLATIVSEETGKSWEEWQLLMSLISDDSLMNERMREEWHSKSRATPGEIRQYYTESDTWLAQSLKRATGLVNIVEGVEVGGLEPWYDVLTEGMAPKDRVLDFGGAFLADSWQLICKGFHVELAEIEGPITAIVSRWAKENKCKALSVLPVSEDFPLKGMYSGAICMDTLEHVKEPDKVLAHIVDHLYPGSCIAMSVCFGDTPHAPYHLAETAHFGDLELWASTVKSMGMEFVYAHPSSHIRVWRKL